MSPLASRVAFGHTLHVEWVKLHSLLGLAIARSLARAHDGDVELDTALGRGARFRLTLPLHET